MSVEQQPVWGTPTGRPKTWSTRTTVAAVGIAAALAAVGGVVVYAATGGSERHALVIDHQLRPLFSFFQALTLPIGVYASEADFTNYQVSNELLKARIQLAVERAAPLFAVRSTTLQKIA